MTGMNGEYESGLISVILPTFNRGHLIIRALDSIQKQLYRPGEVIIVDDGSTDSTKSKVAQWAGMVSDADFRVRYLVQENHGAPSARNRGLVESRGEYIQFLDSDDWITVEKLPSQIEIMRSDQEVDYVWSRSLTTNEIVETVGQKVPPHDKFLGRHRVAGPLRVSEGVYRRSVCLAVGPWNTKLDRYQDWEYAVRSLSLCRSIAFVDIVGYIVFVHKGERISSGDKIKYADQIVSAYQEFRRQNYRSGNGYIARFKCSQALLSAAIIYVTHQKGVCARNVAREARRIAPLSRQKWKALLCETATLLVPTRVLGAGSRHVLKLRG